MDNYVSIIVAVISLATSLLTAALTTGVAPFITSFAKKRKARRDSEELFQKYRKKLFSASHNLQLRLEGIFHADVLKIDKKIPRHHDDLYIYTCFVLGELLAWTHILKNQIELLPFALEANKPLYDFTILLYSIRWVVLTNSSAGGRMLQPSKRHPDGDQRADDRGGRQRWR